MYKVIKRKGRIPTKLVAFLSVIMNYLTFIERYLGSVRNKGNATLNV